MTLPLTLPGPAAAGVSAPIRCLSLRCNLSWTLLGNTIYTGCQWLMLVVIAKLGSAEMLGRFALAVAITAPVMLLADLNLRAVQATDCRGEFEFGDYLGLRLVTLAAGFLVVAGIALSIRPPQISLLILILALAKLFDLLSATVYGLLQQQERMERIAISRVTQGLLQLAALGALLRLTGSVVAGAIGLAVTSGLVTAGYDLPSAAWALQGFPARSPRGAGAAGRVRLRPLWSARTLARLAGLSWPLGVVGLLDSLNANIPRYFVEQCCGKGGLGYFAAAASVMLVGVPLVDAVTAAAAPRMARQFVSDRRAFKSLLLKLLALGAAMGLGGVLAAVIFGRDLLRLLFRPDYASHASVLVWVMVATAAWYVAGFLGAAITAARYFRVQAPLFAGTVLGTALASLLLVPRYGLLGAAWALGAGMGIRLLGSAGIMLQALRAPAPRPAA